MRLGRTFFRTVLYAAGVCWSGAFTPVWATEFYVNDTNRVGDIYTDAIGNDLYNGTNRCCPKATLQAVLLGHDLAPGDIVYVDTGYYVLTNNVPLMAEDSGAAGHYVVIQGSTNLDYGGTVLHRTSSGGTDYVLDMNGVTYALLADLNLVGGAHGVHLENGAGHCLFENVAVSKTVTSGFFFDANINDNLVLHSSVTHGNKYGVWNQGAGNRLIDCTVADNGGHQVALIAGSLEINNSLLVAGMPSFFCLLREAGTGYAGDYNDLYATNGACVAKYSNTVYASLLDWQRASAQDTNSLCHDPLFAQSASNDYRLRSRSGRYARGAGWTNDPVHSPCIDMGHPASIWTNEPMPNGGRINQGADGGSFLASMSLTNEWLLAVALNDGGTVRGEVTLRWRSGLTNPLAPVRLDYARDESNGWQQIASGLPAGDERYSWSSTNVLGSPFARWRVVAEDDPTIWDMTDRTFELRPFVFYINDAETNSDQYCTAPGNDLNSGIASNAPKATVQGIVTNYDLDWGDRVLIDNGRYVLSNKIVLGAADSGESRGRVVFQGGTNSVLVCPAVSEGLWLNLAAYIEVADLVFSGGVNSVKFNTTSNCLLRQLTLAGAGAEGLNFNSSLQNRLSGVRVQNSGSHGVYLNASRAIMIDNMAIAACAGHGLYVFGNASASLTNCVVTANRKDQLVVNGADGRLDVRNSIVTVSDMTQFCVRAVSGTYAGDYNDYYTVGGGYVGYRNGVLARLSDWQAGTGQDSHSLCHDPLFADAAAGDFHLKSLEGRYVRDGLWTNDSVHSPCIDAGDPSSAFAAEPMERGPRVNLGLYGNTPEASKSLTNAWVLAVSFNDGGTARGIAPLTWNTGFVTTETVGLEYSTNGGMTWVTIATVPAGDGAYAWDTSEIVDIPAALWRAVLVPPGVAGAVEQVFAINPRRYFLNDAFTNGDIYCAAPGSVSNWGLQASAPMLSLSTLLAVHQVEPGSVVYVDTGTYALSNNVEVTRADSGNSNAWVRIQGSTNYMAGGSVLERRDRTALACALRIDAAARIGISDLSITGGYHGVQLYKATNVTLSKLDVRGAGNTGIYVQDSPQVLIENCQVWKNAWGVCVDGETNSIINSTVAHNTERQVSVASGGLNMTNSILVCGISNRFGVYMGGGTYNGNYNDLLATNGAIVGFSLGNRRSLSDWQAYTGQDASSLAHDPLFADTERGDFHLMSRSGRYVRATGTWVADAVQSPCIDTGDPASDFAREPVPNGLRVNMGSFGNTGEASLSTNEWLLAVSFNDGGTARGMVPLIWESKLEDPLATVRLDYSADNGAVWVNIASNVLAVDEWFIWASTNFHGSPLARWRVVSESNTSVWDLVDAPFNLRPLRLYVNDPFSSGDVFTTAPGNDLNTGVFSNAPKATVQAILDAYDLDRGDQVFIDTGLYAAAAPLNIKPADSGASNVWVTFRGTTNGTVLQCTASNVAAYAVYFNNSAYVELCDLNVLGGYYGLYVSDAQYIRFSNVMVAAALHRGVQIQGGRGHALRAVEVRGSEGDGVYVSTSSGNLFERCLVWSNAGYGVYLSGISNSVRYSVMAQNGRDQIRVNSGPVRLHNNIVVADQIGQYGLYRAAGDLQSDFNDWYAPGGACVGYYNGVRARLSDWQLGSGQDTNSMARDPRFADPAAGDFHARSLIGRFDPVARAWTQDVDHSYCIDAADPADSFVSEEMPNGGRANQGMHGDTRWASMSVTAAWVRVLNYADGGVARELAELRWTYGNLTGTETVNLLLSLDDGATWTNLGATAVGNGLFTWDTAGLTDCPDARWRLELAADPAVADQSDRPFAVNPFSFYINDTNTAGDVYCTAPGDDRNDGVSSNRPMVSVQRLLDIYDLEPGAVVYVDTGNYLPASDIEISSDDSGWSNAYVRIKGSPNRAAGGSLFGRSRDLTANTVLHAVDTDYLLIEELIVTGGYHGVYMQSSSFCMLSNLTIRGALVHSIILQDADHNRLDGLDVGLGDGNGIYLSQSDHLQLNHSQIWGHAKLGMELIGGLSNRIRSCVFAENRGDQILLNNGTLGFRNNIVVASVKDTHCLNAHAGIYEGDYNDFFTTNGALMGLFAGNRPSLSDWRAYTGTDTNSLSHDPLFADPAAGNFHVRSVQGRYNGGVWVVDADHSPCIDAGDPLDDWSLEPLPNGNRVNMGLHGGTAEASLSNTNDWLLAVTYNDGGVARQTVDLRWRSGLNDPAAVVDIEYSPDHGLTWTVLAANLPAGQEVYAWPTTNYIGSPYALWRVVSTGCADRIDRSFQVRPFKLFLNDDSMVGDIYCTTNGSDDHTGASSNSPMATLFCLLNTFDLEPDDILYIDTGFYPLTNNAVILPDDGGGTNGLVHFLGSTNVAFGGSRFSRPFVGPESMVFYLNGTDYLHLRDLEFLGGEYGIGLYYANHCLLENIRAGGASRSGILVDRGLYDTIRASRITGCGSNGLHAISAQDLVLSNLVVCSNRSQGIRADNSEIWVGNCTLADNGGHQIYLYGVAKVNLRNSILSAGAPGAYALYMYSGTYSGDYNNVHATGEAYAVYADGPKRGLLDWQIHSGMDVHSLSHDPRFVDAAGGDYHLRSGPGAGSPCIDAGDPGSAWTNEPMPNGSRINQGAYGNTAEAERSDTNAWIVAVSCNQGGLVRGAVDFRWNSNLDPGGLLRLEYSGDDGLTWEWVDSGLSPAQEYYRWNATNRSATARWRVILESDTNIWDQTDGSFILNPNRFFVNDSLTQEDVYTAGPGWETNRGASAATPMRTLQALLDVNDIEPGDAIFVDTGYYLYSNNLTLGADDAGTSNLAVFIQGSTNRTGQRTVLDRASRNTGALGFYLNAADSVNLSHLRMTNGYYGIYALSSPGCTVSNSEAAGQGGAGVYFKASDRCALAHTRIWGGGRDGLVVAGHSNRASNCTFHGNERAQVMLESGELSLRNSILSAISSNAECVQVNVGVYTGDENDFYTTNRAVVAYWLGERTSLLEWQTFTGQDSNSLAHLPRFVDAERGDFHLRSIIPSGSYVIADGAWTNFDAHSACIDAGPAMGAVTNEPEPNGGRINLGAYGDTPEASHSLTSAWVLAVSLNNGDAARGVVPLRWKWGAIPDGTPLQLEYSRNAGQEWMLLTNGLPVESGVFSWNSSLVQGSPLALWRVSVAGMTDGVDRTFGIRPFVLYVNDLLTNNDVYCSAPGDSGNDGVATNTPVLYLSDILTRYDLEYQDLVYVDTGTYALNSNTVFSSADGGSTQGYVVVQGSTNGSYMIRGSVAPGDYGLYFDQVSYVRLANVDLVGGYFGAYLRMAEHLAFSNVVVRNTAGEGLYLLNSDYNSFSRCSIYDCQAGLWANGSANLLQNCRVWSNVSYGVHLEGQSTNRVSNCTIAFNGRPGLPNQYQVEFNNNGFIRNSILVASGSNVACYGASTISARYAGDYNDLFAMNGGLVASDYATLADWRAAGGQETHSLSRNPHFVGAPDFHLQSMAPGGTLVQATGVWTAFPTNSPGIDTADVEASNLVEPEPNGDLLNMGAYGNTDQASRSMDTDGEGLSDTFEIYQFGTSITNRDTDGDGMTDYDEFVAATDPLNPIQCFETIGLYPIDPLTGGLILRWASALNRRYSIHSTTNLMTPFEIVVTNIPGLPPANTYTVVVFNASQTYLRIEVER